MAIHVDVVRERRKTLSLRVLDTGEVILKVPMNASEKEIDRFLDEKHDWLVKHYRVVENRNAAFQDIVDFKKVLVNGEYMPLVIGPKPGIYLDRVEIRTKKDLKQIYVDKYGQEFLAFAEELSNNVGLTPASMKFKAFKSRWGCCDSHGNITFNYVLLMMPKDEQALVILHELCHLVYMNHSKAFHALLDQMYPGNQKAQKVLNNMSFLLRLYA